jgi:hypothetical protein
VAVEAVMCELATTAAALEPRQRSRICVLI